MLLSLGSGTGKGALCAWSGSAGAGCAVPLSLSAPDLLPWLLLAAPPFHLQRAENSTSTSPKGNFRSSTTAGAWSRSSEPEMSWSFIPFISFLEKTHKKQKCCQALENFSF